MMYFCLKLTVIYKILGFTLIASSIIGCGYLLVWWGIIEPILTIAEMLDNNTTTFMGIAWELVKMFIKDFVAIVWFYLLFFGGIAILAKGEKNGSR